MFYLFMLSIDFGVTYSSYMIPLQKRKLDSLHNSLSKLNLNKLN